MEINIEKKTKIKSYYKIKKYDDVGNFHEGLAWVQQNGRYGFINKEGKEVVEPKYNKVGNFHEGLAWVEQNDKFGFINKEGKEVVKPKYYDVGDFEKGLAWVERYDYYGLIDKDGNEITDICFEDIRISEGVIIFNEEYIVPIENLKLIETISDNRTKEIHTCQSKTKENIWADQLLFDVQFGYMKDLYNNKPKE